MTSLEEDDTASEDIFASYAMGTWDVGALRIIGGVRVENTRFKAEGNQVDVAANGRSYTVTPRVANSSYTNVLPGLHLRYDAGDAWVLRAAANKTVSRPSFGDIAPRIGLSRGDEEVRIGNPQLDPYESKNIDLSAEWYYDRDSYISVGYFNKDVSNFISSTRSDSSSGRRPSALSCLIPRDGPANLSCGGNGASPCKARMRRREVWDTGRSLTRASYHP